MSQRAILPVLLLLVMTTGLCLAVTRTPAVVSGVVVVASEDAQGRVEAVEILVEDGGEEEPYLVAKTKKGPELLGYVDQWVIAAGTVTVDDLGWKTIEVEHYSLADKYPDPTKVVR